MQDKKGEDLRDSRGAPIYGEWGRFCAEPPPDSASELTNLLEAHAVAKDASGKEINGSFSNTDILLVKQLFQRSQGVQLFRDGLYNLCQLHANEAIAPHEVSDIFRTLLQQASNTIDVELRTHAKEDFPGGKSLLPSVMNTSVSLQDAVLPKVELIKAKKTIDITTDPIKTQWNDLEARLNKLEKANKPLPEMSKKLTDLKQTSGKLDAVNTPGTPDVLSKAYFDAIQTITEARNDNELQLANASRLIAQTHNKQYKQELDEIVNQFNADLKKIEAAVQAKEAEKPTEKTAGKPAEEPAKKPE